MKNKMKMVLMLLVTLCVMIPLLGCSAEDLQKAEIESLMNTFENACTAMDIDAALDCIDPKVTAPVKAIRGVVGYFLGETDMSAKFFDLLGQMSGGSVEEPQDFFGNMHIDIGKVRADSKKATVTAAVTCNVAGRQIVRDARFRCICEAGQWYISGFSFK